MSEQCRPKPIQEGWELVESLERREDFEKLLAVSKKAARRHPDLKEGCQDLIEKYRLYEVIKVERRLGEVRLTLANLWRLTRYKNPQGLFKGVFDPMFVSLQIFDLAEGRWKQQGQGEEVMWRKHIKDAITYNILMETAPLEWPDIRLVNFSAYRRPVSYAILLGALVEKIIYALGIVSTNKGQAFTKSLFGRIARLPYKQPTQALETALHRHILNRGILRLMQPTHSHSKQNIHLSHYLAACPQRKHLARLTRETPNVLPMLNFIPPAWWARRNLLNDDVLRAATPLFQNISKAGLRWLRKASAETLGEFYRFFNFYDYALPFNLVFKTGEWQFRAVVETMAELSPWPAGSFGVFCQKVVLCGICDLLSLADDDYDYDGDGDDEDDYDNDYSLVLRLVRPLGRHIFKFVADRQRNQAEELPYQDWGLVQVVDWYMAEGHQQGLPDKNSTWVSLKRRADKWHEEIWRRKRAEEENITWESLVGSTEISGIKIKPLVSGLDLHNEGREMRHCIGSYTPRCHEKGWRIFSLTEPDGRRSTLSLKPRKNGMVIDQHHGQRNGPVSPAAAKAAREIRRLYTLKYSEASTIPAGSLVQS